jgi:hypothetical protein
MRQCSNCGTQITCGCQDRMASNGVRVCANCITLYEQQLLVNRAQSIVNQNNAVQNENVSTEQS